MILPIVGYGDAVLRKKGIAIKKDYPNLEKIIEDMFDTMYNASGVGLAAQQVGHSIRLFVVDAKPFAEDEPELENFKRVFINAQMIEEEGDEWKFNEGCLSIPGIREDVVRYPDITLKYHNEFFEERTETFKGISARIIQHEYDHIDGILFTDHLSPLKKRLIKGKLNDISNGKVNVDYKMRFGVRK
jgi:peptide deformylase